MLLPLIPVIKALAAGGTLVPHASGGMIVTSTTGYLSSTYLSTAAIGSLLSAGSTALGAGALYLSGAGAKVIGGAGVFGTTFGSSGATGALMSIGVISSTPMWIPVAIGGAAISGAAGIGYGAYRLYKLKQKVGSTSYGEEAQFSEKEARLVENIVKKLG